MILSAFKTAFFAITLYLLLKNKTAFLQAVLCFIAMLRLIYIYVIVLLHYYLKVPFY